MTVRLLIEIRRLLGARMAVSFVRADAVRAFPFVSLTSVSAGSVSAGGVPVEVGLRAQRRHHLMATNIFNCRIHRTRLSERYLGFVIRRETRGLPAPTMWARFRSRGEKAES